MVHIKLQVSVVFIAAAATIAPIVALPVEGTKYISGIPDPDDQFFAPQAGNSGNLQGMQVDGIVPEYTEYKDHWIHEDSSHSSKSPTPAPSSIHPTVQDHHAGHGASGLPSQNPSSIHDDTSHGNKSPTPAPSSIHPTVQDHHTVASGSSSQNPSSNLGYFWCPGKAHDPDGCMKKFDSYKEITNHKSEFKHYGTSDRTKGSRKGIGRSLNRPDFKGMEEKAIEAKIRRTRRDNSKKGQQAASSSGSGNPIQNQRLTGSQVKANAPSGSGSGSSGGVIGGGQKTRIGKH